VPPPRFHAHRPEAPGQRDAGESRPAPDESALASDESLVELRCSVIVARRSEVLLVRRLASSGGTEWVLPGGRPRAGEGMLACAHREVFEETGLAVTPTRCAFVADVIDPEARRRGAELVFLARIPADEDPNLTGEAGAEPTWIPVREVRTLQLRPPIGGYLPSVVENHAPTAPYLGNLWRGAKADRP
jgi:8-oxo-dGTP diphosphatase